MRIILVGLVPAREAIVLTATRRFDGLAVLVVGGGVDGPGAADGGPAKGIGRSVAQRLSQEGARVAVTDRSLSAAQETVALLDGPGLAIEADAARPDACRDAVRRAESALGSVDVLVCNVGVIGGQTASQQTVENWDHTLDVNVRSHWLSAQAVLPGMTERGRGAIVFVTSVEALASGGISLAYEASKSALLGVTRHFAVRYGRQGVRTNALALGIIATAMIRRLWGDAIVAPELEQRSCPLGRYGTPEEAATAAAFLASADASYVNGTCLVMDGGLTAHTLYPGARA